MTKKIDDKISAKLHAAAINYNHYIKNLFGEKYSIDKQLAFSIQFAEVNPLAQREQNKMLGISKNVTNFVATFESSLPDSILQDGKYSYKVAYIPMNANNRNQADAAVQIVRLSQEQQEGIKQVVFKDREKLKYKPKRIVDMLKSEGYNFSIPKHTDFWKLKAEQGLDLTLYRVEMTDGSKYWYENWIDLLRNELPKP